MITDYQWINDNSELEELILLINESDEVAFDSEFERINTYYPKPALFQLRISDKYYLIDMKEISNQSLFQPLLNNIILHSGSEDLEILFNFNQQLPQKVFDTQVAASLCGYGLHFSYQNIVRELIGIELSKAHSRSDWMQRPLSEDQLNYALDDVVYLPELKQILMEKLEKSGRVEWFDLLMKQRLDSIVNSNHVNKTFVKISKSNRFNPYQNQLLFALLSWREKAAMKRDRPRPWILKNDEIVKIILQKPSTQQQLIEEIGLYPKFVKYNAQSLFELYGDAEHIDFDSLPKFVRLSAEQGDKHNQIKQQLTEKCEELNIPAALIVNVSDLKSLVAAGKDLSNIEMWQLISN